MPLPSSINDLSTTAGSNSPPGSESPSLIDDYLRTYASYIAQLRDGALIKASPLVGDASNVKMTISAASASGTLTADEIVVGTALGATTYRIASFNKTINLATIGVGGMDTGTAPVNGYVALYAIYNPSSGASALLAVNATVGLSPMVYGGANMPSGYTASSLLTVLPTNASGQFKICAVRGRSVGIPGSIVFSTASVVTNQAIALAALVPANASEIFGEFIPSSSTTSNLGMSISSDASRTSEQNFSAPFVGAQGFTSSYSGVLLPTPQTAYVNTASTAGSPSFIFTISGYKL